MASTGFVSVLALVLALALGLVGDSSEAAESHQPPEAVVCEIDGDSLE